MDTSSVSGYMEDAFEGVSSDFTQFEPLPAHGFNSLTRAKRYGRWYLLKGLNNESRDKLMYQEMLNKEFDIMMRLQHPGVVQVVGMENVEPLGQCIVMEWVEGLTLKDWLNGHPTREQRVHVAQQLMDALAHIHAHDVAHRDIKPSNILITSSGKNVKIIDFGLADTDVHAILKQPAGTQQYMAPEQASTSLPDVRNDIYSLGLVLRAMDLGKEYNKVAERCILPIDERYQSVEEMKADIERRQAHRRTVRIGLAAAALAALIAGIAIVSSRLSSKTQYVQDNKAREQVDSLKNKLGQATQQIEQSKLTQDSLRTHLGGLNDTITQLNAANVQLRDVQREQEQRAQRVEAAIADGLKRIDAANAATHLKEHIDTLSNTEYLWIDWHFQCLAGERLIPEYMNSIRNKFTSNELAQIEYALKEHCNNYENTIIKQSEKKGNLIVID